VLRQKQSTDRRERVRDSTDEQSLFAMIRQQNYRLVKQEVLREEYS
jgi:hypothetical protein